jgi:hypothetical protein
MRCLRQLGFRGPYSGGKHQFMVREHLLACCVPTPAWQRRLNTELAKKPRECLAYIVVHEMTHILEPTHNARFVALMDQFMPQWHFYREQLNRLPVRHEDWAY